MSRNDKTLIGCPNIARSLQRHPTGAAPAEDNAARLMHSQSTEGHLTTEAATLVEVGLFTRGRYSHEGRAIPPM